MFQSKTYCLLMKIGKKERVRGRLLYLLENGIYLLFAITTMMITTTTTPAIAINKIGSITNGGGPGAYGFMA